jgi:hypothetical protein
LNLVRRGAKDEDVLPTDPAATPLEAAEKAVAFYQQIQSEDGHWAMDYGGPMFLMPGTASIISRSQTSRAGKGDRKRSLFLPSQELARLPLGGRLVYFYFYSLFFIP